MNSYPFAVPQNIYYSSFGCRPMEMYSPANSFPTNGWQVNNMISNSYLYWNPYAYQMPGMFSHFPLNMNMNMNSSINMDMNMAMNANLMHNSVSNRPIIIDLEDHN